MNGTIVVGVTDATGAWGALNWAVDRAVAHRERLLLVSVVGSAWGVVGEETLVERAIARATALLEDGAVRAHAAGVDAETRLERGDPVARLIDVSEGAALLVLGSDFATDGSRLRGVRGTRIAAGAHCPVVVVPEFPEQGRAGVVVGVDGSEASAKAVAFAAAEADLTGESLTAVMTWSPVPVPYELDEYPRDYLDRMQTLTTEELSIALAGLRQDYPDLVVTTVVESGYPTIVLLRESRAARLLVVGNHGRGALGRFLLGSTSQAVLTHLPTVTAIVR